MSQMEDETISTSKQQHQGQVRYGQSRCQRYSSDGTERGIEKLTEDNQINSYEMIDEE